MGHLSVTDRGFRHLSLLLSEPVRQREQDIEAGAARTASCCEYGQYIPEQGSAGRKVVSC